MTVKKNEQKEAKRTVHRSPSYPAFGLEEAISKVRTLWEKDGKAGASREVVVRHLGYTPGPEGISGPAARVIAALKKFGLTEESGSRIMPSQRALDILVYQKTDERHVKALKEAGIEPSIYNELYEQYREGLPSDGAIKAELVRKRGFNPRQVDGFLKDFKSTLEFAGLLDMQRRDIRAGESLGVGMTEQATQAMSQWASVGALQRLSNSFPIPLKRQNLAMISFNRLPLHKADIELLRQWIDLMEENLTEQTESN